MVESIICQTYRFLSKSNVSEVRYEKCCGNKFPEPSEIPSTKDELDQHVERISYQVFAWKSALEANQEIPEADQHGWGVIDGNMSMCLSASSFYRYLQIQRQKSQNHFYFDEELE